MTKELGKDNDQDFFFRGGGGVRRGVISANCLSSKIIYHKKSLSLEWFQNGFKLS